MPAKRENYHSDEKIAEILKLWNDGLSASEIARRCGMVSRNAVIGVVNRSGAKKRQGKIEGAPLARGGRVTVPKKTEKQIVAEIKFKEKERVKEVLSAEAPVPLGPVADFPAERTCQYIHGDTSTSEWRMCGHGAKVKSSYCEYHAAKLSFKAPMKKAVRNYSMVQKVFAPA